MEAEDQEKCTQQRPSHTHLAPMEWVDPGLKRSKRPYSISRDVSILEKRKPVTTILRRGSFRGKLEDIFRDIVGGKNPAALRKLQDNVAPASQIEQNVKQNQRILSMQHTALGTHVIPVDDLTGMSKDKYLLSEYQARCKLASLYRVIERMGWTHEIYNHISLQSPGREEHFLINAFGLHYSEVTASNLVKVNLQGDIMDPGSTQLGINRAGYVIHSAIHEARKDIKCIIHIHTSHGAGVSAMSCGLLPLSQEALIVGGVSYHAYRGIACDESEKVELVRDLGPVNKVMILHNHGLLAMGSTVEEAYHICVNLMVACETQVMSLSAGLNNVMLVNSEIAKKVVSIVNKSGGGVSRHGNLRVGQLEYEAMMRVLDNLGYNTGYPYKNMELLIPPLESGDQSPTDSPQGESWSADPQKQARRSSSDDLENVVKHIRVEMKRIKREKERRSSKKDRGVIEKETVKHDREIGSKRDTEHTDPSSSSYQDLEAVARNSEGTTHPIFTGNSPLTIPNMGGVTHPSSLIETSKLQTDGGDNPSLGHNGAYGAPSLHPPFVQSPVKFSTPRTSENQVASSSSSFADGNQPDGHPEAERGIWDFLDERQSQGPLPISRNIPGSPPARDRAAGRKPHDSSDHQLVHHPSSTATSVTPPVLTQENNQFAADQDSTAGGTQPFHNVRDPVVTDHPESTKQAHLQDNSGAHDWQRSRDRSTSTTLTDSHVSFHPLAYSQSTQNYSRPTSSSPRLHPQSNHQPHAQIHPHSFAQTPSQVQTSQHSHPNLQSRPNGPTIPQPHTQTLLQTHSHPQADVQPHPLPLVYPQPDVKPRPLPHYPSHTHPHQHNIASTRDTRPEVYMSSSESLLPAAVNIVSTASLVNSKPAMYVRSEGSLVNSHPTTGETHLSPHLAVKETDPSQFKGLVDLGILSKVEETANIVASSTSEAVEKLATYKQQRYHQHGKAPKQPQTQDEVHVIGSSPKGSDRNGIPNTVRPTEAVNGLLIPGGHSPSELMRTDKGVPNESSLPSQSNGPSTPPMYLYSPPKLDESLTGLEKTLNTARQVAESTGVSVEKLNKSLGIQDKTDSDHQTITNDDDSV